MSALTPIPAIIAACICVPALVALYLLKLRRRSVRISSTLLWVQSVQDVEVNVPFRWLRPTWIFVLQLLAIACFLIAIARPVLNAAQGESGRVVIMIDRSASMSATDGIVDGKGASRLEEAKARALKLIDDLARGGGSTIGVVEFSDQAHAITPLTQNLGDVRAAIAQIAPSDQPGDLGRALRLVESLLNPESAAAEEGTRSNVGMVHIFSDGVSRGADPLAIRGAAARFERVGAGVSEEGHDNLGIVAIAARRDFDDPGTVRIFSRIQNAANRNINASLVLLLDGEEVDRRTIKVPAAAQEHGKAAAALLPAPTPARKESDAPGSAADAPDGTGQLAITFALQTRSAGVATVRIDRPDLLASDNEASVMLRAAVRPRVLLVTPDESPNTDTDNEQRGADWILPAALGEMGVPLRIERASVYEHDAASNGNTPLNVELVVFDRVRPRQAPRCATLSFGAGLPIVGFDAVRRNETPKDQSSAVLSWSRAHPLLRGVGLDSVFIAHALALQDPAQANAADRAPGVTIRELARGIDGPLILLAEDRGVRRVVVGFDLAQSNWPVQVGFPIFLASAIDYLTMRGEDEAGQAFTTREPAELASRRIAPGPIVLDGPMHVEIAPTNAGNTTGINLGVLERAGVYTLAGAPADAPVKVAVNLCDATTSKLEGADRLTISGQSLGASGRDEARRELWTWFVLAGAGLLIIEWMLNAWQTRV